VTQVNTLSALLLRTEWKEIQEASIRTTGNDMFRRQADGDGSPGFVFVSVSLGLSWRNTVNLDKNI